MKQKMIYIFLFICCLGFFSSAKQNEKNCKNDCPYQLNKQKCSKQIQTAVDKETVTDISPFSLFMFNI
jgi:hypothetical protein